MDAEKQNSNTSITEDESKQTEFSTNQELEEYGVWVKVEPEEINGDETNDSDEYHLEDLDISENDTDDFMSEEEEKLLESFEQEMTDQDKTTNALIENADDFSIETDQPIEPDEEEQLFSNEDFDLSLDFDNEDEQSTSEYEVEDLSASLENIDTKASDHEIEEIDEIADAELPEIPEADDLSLLDSDTLDSDTGDKDDLVNIEIDSVAVEPLEESAEEPLELDEKDESVELEPEPLALEPETPELEQGPVELEPILSDNDEEISDPDFDFEIEEVDESELDIESKGNDSADGDISSKSSDKTVASPDTMSLIEDVDDIDLTDIEREDSFDEDLPELELEDYDDTSSLEPKSSVDAFDEIPDLEKDDDLLKSEDDIASHTPKDEEKYNGFIEDLTEFDDMHAFENNLNEKKLDKGYKEQQDFSTPDILQKIEQELLSIKEELSGLKKELTTLKSSEKSTAGTETDITKNGESDSIRFFDDDEDETIALTGDELDNILETAEITEGKEELADISAADDANDLDDFKFDELAEIDSTTDSAAASTDLTFENRDTEVELSDKHLPKEDVIDETDEEKQASDIISETSSDKSEDDFSPEEQDLTHDFKDDDVEIDIEVDPVYVGKTDTSDSVTHDTDRDVDINDMSDSPSDITDSFDIEALDTDSENSTETDDEIDLEDGSIYSEFDITSTDREDEINEYEELLVDKEDIIPTDTVEADTFEIDIPDHLEESEKTSQDDETDTLIDTEEDEIDTIEISEEETLTTAETDDSELLLEDFDSDIDERDVSAPIEESCIDIELPEMQEQEDLEEKDEEHEKLTDLSTEDDFDLESFDKSEELSSEDFSEDLLNEHDYEPAEPIEEQAIDLELPEMQEEDTHLDDFAHTTDDSDNSNSLETSFETTEPVQQPDEHLLDDEQIDDEQLHAPDIIDTSVEQEPSQEDVAIPDHLKEEIKSVLSYMDQLLESLPEEKIQEFANSEHFEVYERLFDELGLRT